MVLRGEKWVARGGNIAPDANQFLCQERDKQFPIKPSAGTAVVMLGHVPQLGKALQSLIELRIKNAMI